MTDPVARIIQELERRAASGEALKVRPTLYVLRQPKVSR